jgi:hypothetical protein
LACLVLACVAGGCNTSDSNNNNNNNTGPTGPGMCQASCPKSCVLDHDCETNQGQLCCDYGAGAKVCQNAQGCPRFCTTDSTCDTSTGQACVRTSLQSPTTVCEPAQAALRVCKIDGDCQQNEVCCGIYKEKICTAANQCPKACGSSTDCDTTSGQICCTSVGSVEPSLSAAGLCLNTNYEPCPKSCVQSSDCTAPAALCCQGVCAATCPKQCNQDSDCVGQICCKAANLFPPPPHHFKVAPTCQGTENYTTCQQCGSSLGCNRCPGCASEAGAGYCSGNPFYNTCLACANAYGCANCAGCTSSLACNGTATACTSLFTQNACQTQQGCNWNANQCTGTAALCTTFVAQNTCQAQAGCNWSTVCNGTLTQCTQLVDQITCNGQHGCNWNPGTGACSGTLTPCTGLTPQQCTQMPGCSLQ